MQFLADKPPGIPARAARATEIRCLMTLSPPSVLEAGPAFPADFRGPPCRAVLTMSAYVYREAFSLVLASLAANDRRPRPVRRSDTVPRLKSNAGSVETSELRTLGEPWNTSEVQSLFLGRGFA